MFAKSIRIPLLIAVCFIIESQAAQVTPLLRLSDADKEINLRQYIRVLEDTSTKLTISEIIQESYTQRFTSIEHTKENFGYSDSAFWIRLNIQNLSADTEWILDQQYTNTHFLDLYVLDKTTGTYAVKKSGILRSLSDRDMNHRRIVFNLTLPKSETQTIYLRYQSQSLINIQFRLLEKSLFISEDRTESFWMGLYYGMFVVLFVGNFALFSYIKDKKYLILVVLIGIVGTTILFFDGYLQVILGNGSVVKPHIFPILIGSGMIAMLAYGKRLLLLDSEKHQLSTIFRLLLGAWALVIVLGLLAGYKTAIMLVIPLTLVTPIYLLVLCGRHWNQRTISAQLFGIGLLAFFTGFLSFVLSSYGYIAPNIFSEHGFRISAFALLFFMSLAVIDHIQYLELNRDQTNRALRINNQKYRAILDQSFQLISVLSPAGKVLDVNRTALMYGDITAYQVIGEPIWRVGRLSQDPVQQTKVQEAVHNAGMGETERLEISLPFEGENQQWLDISIKPYIDDNGATAFLILEARDITERKQAENSLAEREDMFRLISEQSMMGIVILQDDVFKYVNSATTQMNGYTIQDMLNWKPREWLTKIIYPDDLPQVVEQAKRKQAGDMDVIQNYICRSLTKAGEIIWVEIYSRSVSFQGRPADLVTIVDITQRKRAEMAINEIATGISAKTGSSFFKQFVLSLSKVLEADTAFIGLLDTDTHAVVHTQAVCSCGEIVPNMSYALDDTPCENVIGQKTCAYPDNVQKLFPKDQLLINMGVHSYLGTPLLNMQGEPIGIIVILGNKPMKDVETATDILHIFSTRAAAEIERSITDNLLRDARQKLELHVKNTPLGVIEWNTEFEVVEWNLAANDIFGYSYDEAKGRRASDLVILDTGKVQFEKDCRSLLENREGDIIKYENVTKDGEHIICEWYNTPLITESGHVIGIASLVADVTTATNAHLQLQLHRNHLEKMVRVRTEDLQNLNGELESFSYSVSHDLRAPLRSISGFSQLLLSDYYDNLDSEGRDFITRIINNTKHMSMLIDDLLQLSKLGRQTLSTELVDFDDMVANVIASLRESDKHRKVDVKCATLGSISADKGLLRVLVENILGNAWKYTSKSNSAVIEIGKKTIRDETVYFVRDNGVGFNSDYSNKLFQAFQRLHARDDFEGTGIGLATVNRIIKRHGGRIWAESEVGKGATFYFTFPDTNTHRNEQGLENNNADTVMYAND